MTASHPAELMSAVFISINVIDIFSSDHQRAAEVLAKNLHAERGEIFLKSVCLLRLRNNNVCF